MIERPPNLPTARLFPIIGMGHLLGKQKILGFKPGFGLRCAAHWHRYRLDCKRRSTRVSVREMPDANAMVTQALMRLPMRC